MPYIMVTPVPGCFTPSQFLWTTFSKFSKSQGHTVFRKSQNFPAASNLGKQEKVLKQHLLRAIIMGKAIFSTFYLHFLYLSKRPYDTCIIIHMQQMRKPRQRMSWNSSSVTTEGTWANSLVFYLQKQIITILTSQSCCED